MNALERNIRKMQEQSRSWGVGLRPHTKTHKIPEIARMQRRGEEGGQRQHAHEEPPVVPGSTPQDTPCRPAPALGEG
jgi:hypothetical protein